MKTLTEIQADLEAIKADVYEGSDNRYMDNIVVQIDAVIANLENTKQVINESGAALGVLTIFNPGVIDAAFIARLHALT